MHNKNLKHDNFNKNIFILFIFSMAYMEGVSTLWRVLN